jgi:hypothetical protein
MQTVIGIGLAGAAGALARYGLDGTASRCTKPSSGTFGRRGWQVRP